MDISILIATYKRAELLRQEFESFCLMETSGISFEILVVDNADDVQTREVVEAFEGRLPVRYFIEKKRGKSAALNRIVGEAKGEFFVFTDDDVIVDKDWLEEIVGGVERWPDHFIFGGRVLPKNSEIIPEDYKKFHAYPYIYAVADWCISEGEYDFDKVFGPNMIVRSVIFRKGHRFDEHIGPGSGNYIAGGECDFLMRLYESGYKTVYFPNAIVFHQIRKKQCKLSWVLNRAFREGRSWAWRERNKKFIRIFGIPRYAYRAYLKSFLNFLKSLLTFNKFLLKERLYELSRFYGFFYQYLRMRKNESSIG